MFAYIFQFYKTSLPDEHQGRHTFQIKIKEIDLKKEAQYDYGYMNMTFADLSALSKQQENKTLSQYITHFPFDRSNVLVMDDFHIHRAYRGRGIGSEVLSKLLVIFHGMKGVDYLTLSPYPSEFKDTRYLLRKGGKEYSYEYEQLRLEKFFEKFDFQSYYHDSQVKLMRLKTFQSSHKLAGPVTSLLTERTVNQLMFSFFFYIKEDGSQTLDYLDSLRCRKIFPHEFV